MDIVGRPADTEPPTQPDTFTDTFFYIKLKTTFKVIFVSGLGEFMQQYQFKNLYDRMSKLKKGQTVTKSAKKTAMELGGKILMDTTLIGRYVTQKVAAAMAKKTRQYEKKKNLERGGKDGVSGESAKNTMRGGGRAFKKKATTQTNKKSKTPKKSASQSAQGQKSILWSPLRGQKKSRRSQHQYARKQMREELSALKKRIEVDQADLEI